MANSNPLNNCEFIGRVAKIQQPTQVQMGTNQQGQPNMVDKIMFTLAVDRALSSAQRQKVRNGDQSIKTTDFVPLSATGAVVNNIIVPYCPVGKSIVVKAHYTEYQTKDQQTGQTKYGHIFEVDDIGFTPQDSKNLQQNGGNANNGGSNSYGNNNHGNNGYQQPQNNSFNQQAHQMQPSNNSNFAMFDDAQMPF